MITPTPMPTPAQQEYARALYDALMANPLPTVEMNALRMTWAANRHNAVWSSPEWVQANLMLNMFSRMAEVDRAQIRLDNLIGR